VTCQRTRWCCPATICRSSAYTDASLSCANTNDARCRAIEDACRRTPQTAAELVPVMFHRIIDDPHQMGFAFSEVLAHVNYMLREGRLAPVSGAGDGVAFAV